MRNKPIEDQIFKDLDLSQKRFEKESYHYCSFINCNLTSGDFGFAKFMECTFENCDFSSTSLDNTSFRDIEFKGCKMQGLYFDHCQDFMLSFKFEHCVLNYSTFYQMKIKGTEFIQCQMKETDFTEADLSKAVFDQCDLNKAKFEHTNLEQADFRTAKNFVIDPETNRIRKAYFSTEGLSGLLKKYQINIER